MAKLNHVFGNYFSLRIPLVKRTRTVIDGEETDTDTEYTPSPSESVSVRLIRRKGRAFSYIPTVDGSTVTIEDEGKLPLGTYDVEVTITGGEHPMRFCDEATIEIHNATEAAGIVPGETLTATTYTLEGAVFFAMGSGGAGTEQVQSDWDENDDTSPAFIKHKPNIPSLDGYATEGYVTSYVNMSLTGYATTGLVTALINQRIIDGDSLSDPHTQTFSAYAIASMFASKNDLNGLASQQWVNEQNFLKEHQSLDGYATQQWVNEQNFLKQHQDISGKENRMQIVVPDSLSFLAETGKYYRITQSGTITVTLPSVVSNYLDGFLLFFTAASDDCLHFDTQDTVIFADGYKIKAGDICEVNAVHNGGGWQVTVIKFNS